MPRRHLWTLLVLLLALSLGCADASGQISFVENQTQQWVPVGATTNPGSPYWPTTIPDGSPPPQTQGATPPQFHELRPGERYYWVGPNFPAAPAPSDPKWAVVESFLQNWFPSTETNALAFAADVWRDRDPGDSERVSAGAWSQEWNTLYWNPPWSAACPPFRMVGWEPWANGHPGGNHYCSATWALENYMRTGDPRSWRLFVLRTLHLAGQGLDWNTGEIRYEKSSWVFAGDYGTPQWSHMWPEAVYLFHFLTGELQDANALLFTYMSQNPHNWTGYWGIRGSAWYIRAGRCYATLFGVGAAETLAYAHSCLDTRDTLGQPYFPNLGHPWGGIAPWQQWLFLSEAAAAGLQFNDPTVYVRCSQTANWLLANARRADGAVAYEWTPANGATYLSPTHTSYALPYMAWMVEKGDMAQADAVLSLDYVVGSLPNSQGYEGLLWIIPGTTTETRPWGPAAPKIAANLMYGLRGAVSFYLRN